MSDDHNPYSRHNQGKGPYDQPQPGQTPAPPNQSSGSNSCAMIFLGVAVLVTLIVVCCGGISFFGFRAGVAALQAPIEQSITEMSADPAIADKLGTPIESTSTMGVNNFTNNNGNGGADVDFNAKGPKGTAHVTGKMSLTAGQWSVENLDIQFSDGTSVTLPRGGPENEPVDGPVGKEEIDGPVPAAEEPAPTAEELAPAAEQ